MAAEAGRCQLGPRSWSPGAGRAAVTVPLPAACPAVRPLVAMVEVGLRGAAAVLSHSGFFTRWLRETRPVAPMWRHLGLSRCASGRGKIRVGG